MTALVITIAGLNVAPFDGSGLTGVTLTAASFTATAGIFKYLLALAVDYVCILYNDFLVILRIKSMDLPIW